MLRIGLHFLALFLAAAPALAQDRARTCDSVCLRRRMPLRMKHLTQGYERIPV